MMNRTGRIAVIVLLAVAVGGVILIKRGGSSPAVGEEVAPAASAQRLPATSTLPRLLDLGANACVPCKMMAPILEELKSEYAGKLRVDFIDVWKDKAAGEQYQIESIPTQIFFDATGKELFRHEGFYAKQDILAKWKELGVTLNP